MFFYVQVYRVDVVFLTAMAPNLIKNRDTAKAIIERLARYAAGATPESALHDITTRDNLLETTFQTFLVVQRGIDEVTGDAETDFQVIEAEAIENLYFEAKAKFMSIIADHKRQEAALLRREAAADAIAAAAARRGAPVIAEAAVVQRHRMDIKLQPLHITKFAGDILMWKSFSDIFTSSIGRREGLSGSQKLYYLNSYLEGDAARIVRSYDITDANFQNAWTALVTRYDNLRLLVRAQFKKLYAQPKVTKESSTALEKLMDTTTECVRALNSLGLPTQEWDSVIVNVVEERLDAESFRQWESSLDHDAFSTLDELSLFMEKRCRSLRPYVEEKSQSKPNASILKKPASKPLISTSTFLASTSADCGSCGASHLIDSCPKFLNFDCLQSDQSHSSTQALFQVFKG